METRKLLSGCFLLTVSLWTFTAASAQVVPLSTPTYTFTIPPGPALPGTTNSAPLTNVTIQITQTITNDSDGPVWQTVWTVLGTNGLIAVFAQTTTSVRTTMSLSSTTSSNTTGGAFTMGSDDLPSPPPACGDTNTPDTDNDGLPDSVENSIGTSPTNADTDGDGYSDLQEIVLGTSPFDPCLYPPIPLNLLAWWTFDDGTGSYATDASGNLQTGVLESSPSTNAIPTWVTNGVANGALSFDGSNSFLVAPATAMFCALSNQVTVSAWIDAQNQLYGGASPIAKWNGYNTNGNSSAHADHCGFTLEFYDPSNVWFLVYSSDLGKWIGTPLAPVPTNHWTHVVGVYDGSAVRIYTNGALAGSTTTNIGAITLCGTAMLIAHDLVNTARYYHGLMDDVRIYNTALSTTDVYAIYKMDTDHDGLANIDEIYTYHTNPNLFDSYGHGYSDGQTVALGAGTNSVPPHLLGWWQFIDGTGTNDVDSSSNNVTGSLVNTPTWVTNGVIGGALQFGSSSYVTNPVSTLPVLTTQMTVAVWIDAPDQYYAGADPIVKWNQCIANGDIGGFTLEYSEATNVIFWMFSTSTSNWVPTATVSITGNTWTHLAATYDGSDLRIYKNGVAVGSPAAFTDLVNIPAGPLAVAHDLINSDRYLTGQLADVRVYDTALSASNVFAIYNNDSVGDGIPNWWRQEYFGNGTTTNSHTCADCVYTNGSLDNLQEYHCGLDPLVPTVITTPVSTYSGMWSNTASIPSAGPGVSYSWTVSNGTILTGTNTTTILWTAGNAGSATLSVTLSNSLLCNSTISTDIAVNNAYYVDYSSNNDSITNGTNALAPWKHCPGDPSQGFGPGNTTLYPGDTVFFKGGVTYTLTPVGTNVGCIGSPCPNQGGIALNWSGSATHPISYVCTNAWGTGGRAVFTDGYTSNCVAAFDGGSTVSNLVFNNLEFGPIGGSAALPPYTDYSFTTVNAGSTSTGTSPLYVGDSGNQYWLMTTPRSVPLCESNTSFWVQNLSSNDINITGITVNGGGYITTNDDTLPIVARATNATPIGICFSGAPTFGSYTGSVFLTCANGQVLTNLIIGVAQVDSKPGAGIFINGMFNNSTVANCYFHQLGYWFDQQPMGLGSIYGEGVQCSDFNNLTITNCEFAKMAVGCELQIQVASTNLTIANCDFHDAIIWCIDLSHYPAGCTFIGANIAGNTFSNYCQQWAGTNWSGYTYNGSSTAPHSDAIFDRADSISTFTDGTNNNVYNNVFFDDRPGSWTGQISQEGGTSLNVYNNVFSTANSTPIWYHNDNSVNSVSNTQNFVERIFNNTFYEVDNAHMQLAGYPSWIWRIATSTNNQLQVYNNLFYDTAGSPNILELEITNTGAAYPGFKIDYNFYHSSSEQFVYQILTDTTSSNTDLGGLKGYGWETHGITDSTSAVFLDATSTSYSITNNYGLHAGSPAIGAGTNLAAVGLPGLANDITGKARTNYNGGWDLGAYQH